MLVLTRKAMQDIIVGNDIVVRIIDIREDKVRVGIIADPSVPVHRREVQERINEERLATTGSESDAHESA